MSRALLQHLELLRNLGVKELYRGSSSQADLLQSLSQRYSSCQKCPLGATRKNFVYGEGNPNARAMLIGEAPGAEEDRTGHPFVGEAGKLLDKMLAAIDLSRQDIYICNILKCRPPNNRDPESAEREACLPYLLEQIQIIQPQLILMLGRVAAQTLLESRLTLEKLRQTVHSFQGIPSYVTYHPAALLRNPHWKRPAWSDLQKFRDHYLSL
ncbi:MAG: uracil-DNA glycosylase [Candidatus Cloacimonetes bacterium]|nr:uracil-DNA glycosylase [Candidatus Cloacimonadota bacterium]